MPRTETLAKTPVFVASPLHRRTDTGYSTTPNGPMRAPGSQPFSSSIGLRWTSWIVRTRGLMKSSRSSAYPERVRSGLHPMSR